MRIISWNVNSIRARLDHLAMLVKDIDPQVILLQEVRCQKDQLPLDFIEDLGYNISYTLEKGRNGVAILSKSRQEDVINDISHSQHRNLHFSQNQTQLPQHQARFVQAFIAEKNIPIRVASIYVPNGGVCARQAPLGLEVGATERFAYKLAFLKDLEGLIKTQHREDEIVIYAGDYNVAPNDCDVFNVRQMDGQICFHPKERSRYKELLKSTDYVDVAAKLEMNNFTWWDYRINSVKHNIGLRIDHFVMHSSNVKKVNNIEVLMKYRNLTKPSDHAPVMLELSE